MDIIHGTAMAVSDGSYKENYGTSAFIFEGMTTQGRITGRNRIPGSPTDQSAHRSEVGGIVGMAITLKMLCQLYDITSGKITLGLDGQSALNSTSSVWDPRCQKRDFDILWEARKQLQALPITIAFRWVEGHQDDPNKTPMRILPEHLMVGTQRHYGCLDRWAKLNIEADLKAKEYWDRHHHTPFPNRKFTHERITITVQGIKLAQFDIKSLYRTIQEPTIKQHWKQREERMNATPILSATWDATWGLTDWKTQGRAFRSLPLGKQRWLTKHATGHCGVGRMLLHWQWQSHSDCPRCGQPDESTPHLLQCRAHSADGQWKQCLTTLTTWMEEHHTSRDLSRWIAIRLNEWRTNSPQRPIGSNMWVTQAIQDQDRIGWWPFLLGRIAKSMTVAHAKHLLLVKPQNRPDSWTKGLLLQLWDFSFEMWDHRNKILHGPTLTFTQLSELGALLALVKIEFTKGPITLLNHHKWMLTDESKSWALSNSTQRTQKWLDTIRLSRKAYTHQQSKLNTQLARQQRRLRDWLETATPNP
jgi:hypothetical protein